MLRAERERTPTVSSAVPAIVVPSERETGVFMDELPVDTVIEVATAFHTYRMENRGEGKVLISGHPEFCPEPVLVDFHGSVDKSPVIRMYFIGKGLKMEFRHPGFGTIWTSPVREIRVLKAEVEH